MIKLKDILSESFKMAFGPYKNYDVKVGDEIDLEQGSMFKIEKRGSRVYMTDTDHSSNRMIFKDEKKLNDWLKDYVPPKGGTQSSQF